MSYYAKKAEINYAFYQSTIRKAADDFDYIGLMSFFLEQSVEFSLRHLLSCLGVTHSSYVTIPELARDLLSRFPDASKVDSIRDLQGDLGAALIIWENQGRYSDGFIPDFSVMDRAEAALKALSDLYPVVRDANLPQLKEDYTTRFEQFVSTRATN